MDMGLTKKVRVTKAKQREGGEKGEDGLDWTGLDCLGGAVTLCSKIRIWNEE